MLGNPAGMSPQAVEKATGKDWDAWVRVLDRAKAHTWAHRDIAGWLHQKHEVPSWWAQMVTVGYEQAKGLRQKYQKAGGFSATASKTIATPLARLYQAWGDGQRNKWLKESTMTVRKATLNKSMRITWSDGSTHVAVYFWDKGPGKSSVQIEHSKLPGASAVADKKAYWGRKLGALKTLLEGE